ncbi:MAG TPA: TetR/AcrR family transcriptional regulator [Marmoricola sp.]|jgi:AcrR family transcriptional regulator|nr:TetR/AcrR family transcriptional regulator [Marmoricola sp.]
MPATDPEATTPPSLDEGPAPRRGRPGYDQETVLRRAIELFNRQGYDGTSMGDIARELGLSKSAIYHHVPSKQHLLEQALDEALGGLTAAVRTARTATEGTSAYERLRATVQESVRILAAHLPAVTLLLRIRGNSQLELAALARRRDIDEVFAGLVAEAAREGSIRADLPPDLVSRLLFGTVNSLVEWYRPDGPVDPDHLAEAVTAMTFDGLRRRSRR